MSRVGIRPVTLPSGVAVTVDGDIVKVKGPKGELNERIAPELTVSQENGVLNVARPNNERRSRAQHGLARSLIANMVVGVTEGHKKVLEIHGVGYRAQVQGKTLTLSVGYSHDVKIEAPEGIQFEVTAEKRGQATEIHVSGIKKALVGQIAANIRKVRKPDPYKGKGLRYQGEHVSIRPGKRAVGTV
ncbi:MAG: 50S ribosomal protein L6 [Armatimonadetes bacterium]|nr:50S ribosomal protein L6 [Armatimonadota bacterium]